MLAFDLTPNLSINSMINCKLIKHGNVTLEVLFESNPIETINCIVYAEFNNFLELIRTMMET